MKMKKNYKIPSFLFIFFSLEIVEGSSLAYSAQKPFDFCRKFRHF